MRLSKSSMAQKKLKSPVGWGQSVTQNKPTDSLLQLVAVTKESAQSCWKHIHWKAYLVPVDNGHYLGPWPARRSMQLYIGALQGTSREN